jgi:predicted Zn-dependent protease
VHQQLANLAQHSDLKERVLSTVLIDSDQINAFAAPGGVVGINLGLMLYADDVHEYSSVIAHELAHLSQRHFARGIEEQRSQSLTSIAAMIAAIMIGAIGGGDAGIAAISGVQAIAQSKQLSYSRGREQEADRVGLNTLVRADLDPQGMARMFERMQRAYRYSRKPPEFMLTHPLSETRIADAKSHALQYGNVPRETSVEYQMMRARAVVHYATSPLAAVKEFEKRVRDNPESLSARYGLALALSANEQHDQAIALNDQLYSSNSHNILYAASYADVLTKAGKTDQAIKLLERVLKLNPDNPPLSMLYADALVADEQYEAAEAVLKRQSFVNKRDVDVWYNLAEVSGLAGNIVGVHLARAEFFTLHGAYQRAIQHLEYARRLTSRNNEQLHARLDQRITDLRDMLRERRS